MTHSTGATHTVSPTAPTSVRTVQERPTYEPETTRTADRHTWPLRASEVQAVFRTTARAGLVGAELPASQETMQTKPVKRKNERITKQHHGTEV